MSPSNHDPDLLERIAVFRHALICRLLVPEHDRHERATELERILTTEHDIPGTTRTRIADSTLRDWIRSYRGGGFEALKPKARIDTGDSRALDASAIETLLAIKEAEPQLSIRATIKLAREQGRIEPTAKVAHSTVHRLFQRHGLGGRGRHRDAGTDRRRFAFAEPGQLWMSDVMVGPGVMIGGRRRRSYLIALIDDATRVITHAEFASSESLRAFLPVMRRALLRRGVPERLYVDNGAAFRAHQLSLICARLNIALIHSRPYQPAGKGKIERFFRTVRAQLLPTLTDEDTTSLEAINRRLAGWIEGEYHRQPHRGLDGDTPLDRFSVGVAALRFPENDSELDELFLFEARRKVNSDRTVSLEGRHNGDRRGVDRREGDASVRPGASGGSHHRRARGRRGGARAAGGRVRQLLRQARSTNRRDRGGLGPDAAEGALVRPAHRHRHGGSLVSAAMDRTPSYCKHFAMSRFPFDGRVDADALFGAMAQTEASVRLEQLLQLRGIGLLTGEPGSGKTTLCRRLVDGLHPGLFRLVYVPLSTGNVMDMYKSIAWELGLPTERNRAAAFRQIRSEVTRLVLEGKQTPVLIVDEAHHLRNEVLEDLRLLTNYEMDSENRLCLLFVGLTELRRRLSMALHESLDQRIVMRYHLDGLEREEVPEYLAHRLRGADCEVPLFEPGAIEAIFQATRALPRRINRLAHVALTAAAIEKARTVTGEHVQDALAEIGG